MARTCAALYIFTSKCPSRHNCVHFFDISPAKSGPKLVCFVHFEFEMCFAPQRRSFFLTSQLPKVVRHWCVLYILTWKSASRHNGVQFFISHVASWFRTRRFSEPTFRPSGATNHWKNSVSRLPYLFAHLHRLSSYFFSFIFLSSNLSLLSASSLLCFPSVHIVGSLTSKFPSKTVRQKLLWGHHRVEKFQSCRRVVFSIIVGWGEVKWGGVVGLHTHLHYLSSKSTSRCTFISRYATSNSLAPAQFLMPV